MYLLNPQKVASVFAVVKTSSDTLIITTYQTPVKRHGPVCPRNSLRQQISQEFPDLRKDEQAQIPEARMKSMKLSPEGWPEFLTRCFEGLIMDKGHDIRHDDIQTWSEIRWPNAHYHIMMTALFKYDVQYIHVSGKWNVVADGLSRIIWNQSLEPRPNEKAQ